MLYDFFPFPVDCFILDKFVAHHREPENFYRRRRSTDAQSLRHSDWYHRIFAFSCVLFVSSAAHYPKIKYKTLLEYTGQCCEQPSPNYKIIHDWCIGKPVYCWSQHSNNIISHKLSRSARAGSIERIIHSYTATYWSPCSDALAHTSTIILRRPQRTLYIVQQHSRTPSTLARYSYQNTLVERFEQGKKRFPKHTWSAQSKSVAFAPCSRPVTQQHKQHQQQH